MTLEQAAEFAGKEWEARGKEVSEEEWALVDQPMRFVPVGFEAASGAFGRSALDFFRQVEVVAGRSASTDLYHWSAFVFGEHWRQRLSLALTRGQPRAPNTFGCRGSWTQLRQGGHWAQGER